MQSYLGRHECLCERVGFLPAFVLPEKGLVSSSNYFWTNVWWDRLVLWGVAIAIHPAYWLESRTQSSCHALFSSSMKLPFWWSVLISGCMKGSSEGFRRPALCSTPPGDIFWLFLLNSTFKTSDVEGNLQIEACFFLFVFSYSRQITASCSIPLLSEVIWLLILHKNLCLASCFSNIAVFPRAFLKMLYLAKIFCHHLFIWVCPCSLSW